MNMEKIRNPDLYISLQIFPIWFVPLKLFICILNRKLEHFILKRWHLDPRRDDGHTPDSCLTRTASGHRPFDAF